MFITYLLELEKNVKHLLVIEFLIFQKKISKFWTNK